MLKDLNASHAKIVYDIALQSDPENLLNKIMHAYLINEFGLEGVVINKNELERAVATRPVNTRIEADMHHAIRNLSLCFKVIFMATNLDITISDADLEVETNIRDQLAPFISTYSILPLISIEFAEFLLRILLIDESGFNPKMKIVFRDRPTSPGIYHLNVIDSKNIESTLGRLFDDYQGLHQRLNPIEFAANYHWHFMEIFPYDEHTGLLGRLLSNAYLMWNRIPPALILQRDRPNYFAALNESPEALVEVIQDGIKTTEKLCFRELAEEG